MTSTLNFALAAVTALGLFVVALAFMVFGEAQLESAKAYPAQL